MNDQTTALRPARAGNRRAVAAFCAASAAGAAYLYAVSPEQPGHYPLCPSLFLTGWWCPGCGGLRSLHALVHGDLAMSLARHPFVAPGLVVLLIWWVGWLRRGRPPVRVNASGWRFRLVLVGLGVFWIVRNLPGFEWLSPE